MSAILKAAAAGWGWKLGQPVAVIAQNAFGNIIVRSESGGYFRIIPEDLDCIHLADSPEELERVRRDPEFREDWDMRALVEKAEAALGSLSEGQCYHLVIPSVLGGAYAVANIKRIALTDWLGFSGEVARQIADLPDGTQVKLKWV
jgi:hypothetical protein